MAFLDPTTADRILTPTYAPFTSLPFGDVDLETTGEAAHPSAVSAQGWPAIPRRSSVADVAALNSGVFAPENDWTLFLAVENGASLSTDIIVNGGHAYCVMSAGAIHSLTISGVTLTSPTLDHPVGSGVSVFAFTCNSTNTFMQGNEYAVIASGAGVAESDPSIVRFDTTSGDFLILGAWLFESQTLSEVDVLDTAIGITAMFEAEAPEVPVPFSGVGGWGIGGSATFKVGERPAPPIPPNPTPGGSKTPPAKPTPATPSEMTAAGVYPLMHVWETMPAADLATVRAGEWAPTAYDGGRYGYIQIVVEGVDITLYGGAETPFPSWRRGEPFGSQSATIELPQISAFHAVPSWARHGANVSIDLVKIGGGSVSLFEGFVMDKGVSEPNGVFTLECMGCLFGADLTLRPPSFTTAPQDIGNFIPALLNAVSSRRWLTMTETVTGISTTVAGGWEPLLTGYIQGLLATALDEDSKQWTVKCVERTPVLERKDTTTIATTVRTGQRGISIDLNSDDSQAPKVIYGEGVNKDGGRWRNAKYPNWKPDDTPAYPNTDAANTIHPGESDSDTDSGDGVSTFEAKLGLPVDGYYSQSDRDAVMRAQRRLGITVDGFVGPQTWAAIFDTGANTGSLDGAKIHPLAYVDAVEPRLYGPDGDDLGPNPAFDEDVPRVEEYVNYGQGVSKAEGIESAERQIMRDSDPGWAGVMSWEMDPVEKSRYEFREGENIRILDWPGVPTLDVHVASARFDEDLAVLEVDSKARDYPTLQAIMTRDRDAVDPAKVAAKRLLAGKVQTDRATFDAESPAGRMPRHAIYGGLWDVRRIPMGAYGTVVRTRFVTTSSASKFALAIFGREVTAADLNDWVGNPLTASSNPWNVAELDEVGMFNSWGWSAQPAGYYPGQYSDPDGEDASPLTGVLDDTMSWDYASDRSPWIWVAAIAANSCYIEGRLYGAPGDI